ncbi:MAG: hypothetical protein IPN19_09630 [Elusimicrobia bacterium]|nr:hypothetical protein [Elusimicrobiota bacterium]
MTFGLPYSFGPFVVVHEGEGFLSAFERSRFLTRDLRINLFFLQGFLFVVLCGAFSVFSAIPNRPTFTNHVLESVVITATSGLVGLVWNHAFRQALDLEGTSGTDSDATGADSYFRLFRFVEFPSSRKHLEIFRYLDNTVWRVFHDH